jgi:A/G-specific adenine glycosylase
MSLLKSNPAPPKIPNAKLCWLQSQLLDWYYLNRRQLPWRGIHDPYKVWISEVMLQQTQVKTVIPYYEKFLKVFPDLSALAKTKADKLLKCWAGLGYYSRARNLRKAARVILSGHGGEFPETLEAVNALPGIGRYTAAAILSICFGEPLAVLDGNVMRVLTRAFKIHANINDGLVRKQLWKLAQDLLVHEKPGDFNQALMELGATVCTPRQPKCAQCPWKGKCLAKKANIQELLPEKGVRLSLRKSFHAAVILEHRGKYLLIRRSGKGQLQGFWEFPGLELKDGQVANSIITKYFQERYALQISELRHITQVRHSITTRRMTIDVFRGLIRKSHPSPEPEKDARWVSSAELRRYPFSSATLRILNEVSLK